MLLRPNQWLYSTNPDADRAFLRDVLKLTNVDVGGGWLIFGLPPAEVAVHPSNENGVHEFYLMCDDVEAFIVEMKKRNVACRPVQNQGWGLLTHLTLPGGGSLSLSALARAAQGDERCKADEDTRKRRNEKAAENRHEKDAEEKGKLTHRRRGVNRQAGPINSWRTFQ